MYLMLIGMTRPMNNVTSEYVTASDVPEIFRGVITCSRIVLTIFNISYNRLVECSRTNWKIICKISMLTFDCLILG